MVQHNQHGICEHVTRHVKMSPISFSQIQGRLARTRGVHLKLRLGTLSALPEHTLYSLRPPEHEPEFFFFFFLESIFLYSMNLHYRCLDKISFKMQIFIRLKCTPQDY